MEDTFGWNKIDQWGVWDFTLCQFPTMLGIPSCYRAAWAAAMGKVMTAIQVAEGGIQLERSLKWFLILPKALFRMGRRGGKAGKGLVAQRMNCLVREDWRGLLTLLEKDCKLAESEDRMRGDRR